MPLKKPTSANMEQVQIQIEKTNKLHNRHVAKILTRLNQINTSAIIIDAVKRGFSHYTKDIKEQVLTSNYQINDTSNKQTK